MGSIESLRPLDYMTMLDLFKGNYKKKGAEERKEFSKIIKTHKMLKKIQ